MSNFDNENEERFIGSERARPKNYKLFNMEAEGEKELPLNQEETTANQGLEVVRKEVKEYLEKANDDPSAKVIQIISNIYEDNLAMKDYQLNKLLANDNRTNYDNTNPDDSKYSLKLN